MCLILKNNEINNKKCNSQDIIKYFNINLSFIIYYLIIDFRENRTLFFP